VSSDAEGESGPFSGYAEPAERPPLLSYAALAAIFNGLFAGSGPAKGRR
jgi:hypothetical protein